jgi:hypothetical protein
MKTTTKIFGVLLILLASVSLSMAAPQTNASLPLSANVGSTSLDGPVIQKMFVLPLVNSSLSPIYPDKFVVGSNGPQVVLDPGVADTDTLKYINKYVIVTDPTGASAISAVDEQLQYPNGTYVHTWVSGTDITNTSEQTDALNAAWKAGLISSTELSNYTYELNPSKKQAKMYRIQNTVNSEDPAGNYTVTYKAIDNYGAYVLDYTKFEVMTLNAIAIDFNSIDYGNVSIGILKVISGDEAWGGRPSIANEGNNPILKVAVYASDLTGQTLHETIPATNLSCEVNGDHEWLSKTPLTMKNPILPSTTTQIDFDIQAPLGTAKDVYTGNMYIKIA